MKVEDTRHRHSPTKIALVTGGFDPIHSGHIQYLKAAATYADYLIVGLNSDEWLTRKKGRPFMPFEEREAILNELLVVDKVISFDDEDIYDDNGNAFDDDGDNDNEDAFFDTICVTLNIVNLIAGIQSNHNLCINSTILIVTFSSSFDWHLLEE